MLETKFVFIDTQVYVNLGFNTNNGLFKKIKELGKNAEIELITTTITVNEIEANIKKRMQEELTSVSKLKSAKQLKSVRDALEAMPSIDEASEEIIYEFKRFLNESGTKILPIDDKISEEVFDKYFKSEPPFGSGKKKSEFPDAFALGTVSEYIDDGKCYVISGDGDHASACIDGKKLIGYEKLSSFLDAYNSHQEERKKQIESWFSKHPDVVSKILSHRLENEDFICADSDDGLRQDYEIYGFELLDATINSVSIIDLTHDSAIISAEIDASAKIKYSYYSYEMAIYDKEDDRYFGVENEKGESKIELFLPCSFSLLIDESGDIEIDDLQIDDPDAFDVSNQI